jgi:iron complex transport system substrate-binding protein
MRRSSTLLVSLLLVMSLFAGSAAASSQAATYEPCEFPVTLTDATGTEITIEQRPDRVTTTNPSAAQTLWEIDGKSQVVGLTQNALYLDGAEERTDVSGSFGVDVEKVAGTEPDLVLAPNASANDVQALRDAGLTVYHFPEATDIETIRRKTTTMGTLTGNCEGAAEANAWMDANVEAVGGVTEDVNERPRVLLPIGGGFVVGDETFINSILDIAGADNVAAAEHTGYVELSDEVVLELDPDVLVVTPDMQSLVNEEPYASTTAGQENNTVLLQTQYYYQPAPRSVVFSSHNATEQLHPDRYSQDRYVPRSEISVEPAGVEASTPTSSPTMEQPTETDAPTGTETSAPGFGALGALVAVLAGVLLATRRG